MRVLKKAIVDDWLDLVVERVGKRVWYCWIGLDWLLDDGEKLVFGVGDGCSYTFWTILASLFLVGQSVKHPARDCVVRPLSLCDIAWCWSVMAMLILN